MSKQNIANEEENKRAVVISYLTLRKAVGFVGISFPVVLSIGALVLGGYDIQSSISAYYHTNMRNVFVGMLCAIALFLFSYQGYGRDKIAGIFAGIFAIGTALLPTAHANPLIDILHFASASLFFLILTYFSLFLFTKSHKARALSKRKQTRNRVYRVCGYTMLGCLVLIIFYFLWLKKSDWNLGNFRPVFWLESIALWAFGISWLTKGQAIFKDVNPA